MMDLMKLFPFITCLLFANEARTEVIHDGWVWKYRYIHSLSEIPKDFTDYEYSFGKEVEFNGKQYRSFDCMSNILYIRDYYGNLSSEEQPLKKTWYFREEKGVTYVLYPELFEYEMPVYNFNAEEGVIFESFCYPDGIIQDNLNFLKVLDIEECDEYSKTGRIFLVRKPLIGGLEYEISENMGFLDFGELGYFVEDQASNGSHGPTLISVKDAEGNEIYSAYTSNSDDLVETNITGSVSTIVYDLMGHIVEEGRMLPGSVYIRNGCKFVYMN